MLMRTTVLSIIGILAILYGFMILGIGSGTKFWMVWEVIGVFFFVWAFLIHIDFFAVHKIIGWLFHIFLIAGAAMFILLAGMSISGFRAEGADNLDYIIVLGAQVREDGPSVVLKYRLNEAIDYLNGNPETLCIVSGGQGVNEPVSEARCMADYLIENGIDSNRIILEDKSKNTVENIKYSKELMENTYNGVGIITNNFHVFRAVQIAKKQELKNIHGIAADATLLYLPNNILRECMGIFKDWIFGNIDCR